MIRANAFAVLMTVTLAALPVPGLAQGLFSPRVTVNERAITNYEVDQRVRMLTLFGAPGDVAEAALRGLIDDRLRLNAADQLGITVSDEDVIAGMEEFAGRANLSGEEFLAALANGGVEPESFRDFVRAGVLWREVVRARFLPRAQITEAEIDRAMAQTTATGATRVLLSEIRIPAPEGKRTEARILIDRIRREARDEGAFAAAARQYSAAGSAGRGGRLDLTPVSDLPQAVSAAVLGLPPGGVSQPIEIDGDLVLFQVISIEQAPEGSGSDVVVEYAQFLLPEGPGALADAEKVRQRLDTCDDLYGVARGLPEERLQRESRALRDVPQDIARELALLDANEVSTTLVRGGARVVLMLCGRNPQINEAPSREAVREQLRNQRLAAYADGYLEELRADAIILEK